MNRSGCRYIASLPWYDLAEVADSTDALWRQIAGHMKELGIDGVPFELSRESDYEAQWDRQDLLLSQACGYDVVLAHPGKLQVVATPCYSAPGCVGGNYRSFVVVREDSVWQVLRDLRGARCVINTPTSHSGMNILRAMVAPLHVDGRFFSDVKISGSHELSLSMILEREADVAAVDCVTYALLKHWRPAALAGTRILCKTEPVPAPPYVTSAATPEATVRKLRKALSRAIAGPGAFREQLFLDSVETLGLSAYDGIAEMERSARELRYGEMIWSPA